MTHPMTIDAEKLEEALKIYGAVDGGEMLGVIVAAARVTLASLPRFKEVEVFHWVAVDGQGNIVGVFNDDEEGVREFVLSFGNAGYSAVRLTGTAKVRA